MPALDAATKGRVRYHLSYPSIDSAAYIELQGVILASVAVNNKLEYAMDNLRTGADYSVLRILGILDKIEEKMAGGALCRLQASSTDEVDLNPDELTELEKQYIRWARKLADMFFCKFYPGSYLSRIADKVLLPNTRHST